MLDSAADGRWFLQCGCGNMGY